MYIYVICPYKGAKSALCEIRTGVQETTDNLNFSTLRHKCRKIGYLAIYEISTRNTIVTVGIREKLTEQRRQSYPEFFTLFYACSEVGFQLL